MATPLLDAWILVSIGGIWYFGSSIDIITFTLLKIYQNKSTIQALITPHLPSTILALLLVLTILLTTRTLLALSSKSFSAVNGPLKPLLFPCQTTHTRLFPKRHSFSYSYLLAGIPIGWSGSIGKFLSADIDVPKRPWYRRLFSLEAGSAWYTVHADDYLSRDHVDGGLRGKLDHYLISQGERPQEYPAAYLLTAARFFGYSSNPVSIWNLYSPTHALSAVILEVNNTFDERHIYFLKSTPSPSLSPDQEALTHPARFTHKWPKSFYVSPFNSRSGSYSLSNIDPFFFFHSDQPSTTPAIDSVITLTSSQNHPKLTARIFSTTPPIDPSSLSAPQKMIFLSKWWWVGLATFPRTVRQAFKLFVQKSLPWVPLPEPGGTTISRHANPTETLIEHLFRDYLQQMVETSDRGGVRIRYSSSGVSDMGEVIMMSPAAQLSPSENIQDAMIKVLSPSFYSGFIRYTDLHDALRAGIQNATVEISNPSLLLSLLQPFVNAAPISPPRLSELHIFEKYSWKILSYLRPSIPPPPPSIAIPNTKPQPTSNIHPQLSPFESYILTTCAERERKAYLHGAIQMFIASHVAFGWVEILSLEIFVVKFFFFAFLCSWMS